MMIRGKAEPDARTVRAAGGDIELKETVQFVIDQGKVLDTIITHTAKSTDRCAKKKKGNINEGDIFSKNCY